MGCRAGCWGEERIVQKMQTNPLFERRTERGNCVGRPPNQAAQILASRAGAFACFGPSLIWLADDEEHPAYAELRNFVFQPYVSQPLRLRTIIRPFFDTAP